MIRQTLALAVGLGLAGLSWAQSAAPVTVAAASDLKFAIEEVGKGFEQKTGQRLRLIFGSSGNFYAQILQGAPFHVFMSADEAFVFKLAKAGKTKDQGRLYAYGRIAIMVPKGSAVKADGQLSDLAAAINDGRVKKFAIANPEHAPYGMRAQEALEHRGLWQSIRRLLVYGENVSQAMQFALSGSAQGGIIAYSLALAPQIKTRGEFALIPEDWHKPLAQRMVVLKGAPIGAQQFFDYLATPEAQQIMKQYGFAMPGQ